MASCVELAGPPGSGKSTLVERLVGSTDAELVRAGSRRGVLSLVPGAIALARPYLHQARRMGPRRWNRFSLMIRLRALERAVDARQGPVLLDQGPVYMLSILQRALVGRTGGGSDSTAFEAYWIGTIDGWARRLDHVVVLEAPDEILLARVRDRGTPHPLRGMKATEAEAFLRRSSRSRERVLEELRGRSWGPSIERIPVAEASVRELADRVLPLLSASNPVEAR